MKTKGSVAPFKIVLAGTAALLVCIFFYFFLSTDKQLPTNGSAQRNTERDAPVDRAQPLVAKPEIGAVSDVPPAPQKEAADEKFVWPQSVINQNKARVETELANLELVIENRVEFDFSDTLGRVSASCQQQFKFGVNSSSINKRFDEIVAAGITLNTQQARDSHRYTNMFYEHVCDAIGPVTAQKLSDRLREYRAFLHEASESKPKQDIPSLLTALYSSRTRQDVFSALHTLAQREYRNTLWSQEFMHAGHSMPAKFDRLDSATLGLVMAFFACKTSPDECMPGTFITIGTCQSSFICAPGLSVNDYAAMLHSSARIEAANQIADALIAQRKAISTLGRRN